jgi:hypothetical protein
MATASLKVVEARAEKMRAQWARERAEAKIERLNQSLKGSSGEKRAAIDAELKEARSLLQERKTAEAKAVKVLADEKARDASAPKGLPSQHSTAPRDAHQRQEAASRKGPRAVGAPEPIPAPRKRRSKLPAEAQVIVAQAEADGITV